MIKNIIKELDAIDNDKKICIGCWKTFPKNSKFVHSDWICSKKCEKGNIIYIALDCKNKIKKSFLSKKELVKWADCHNITDYKIASMSNIVISKYAR
jgi:hypothetical protein